MIGYGVEELEASRPRKDVTDAVNYCLKKLYEDRQHSISDEVCPDLTYEELIGALLLARDLAKLKEGKKKRRKEKTKKHVVHANQT
jgi:hypothetical protein